MTETYEYKVDLLHVISWERNNKHCIWAYRPCNDTMSKFTTLADFLGQVLGHRAVVSLEFNCINAIDVGFGTIITKLTDGLLSHRQTKQPWRFLWNVSLVREVRVALYYKNLQTEIKNRKVGYEIVLCETQKCTVCYVSWCQNSVKPQFFPSVHRCNKKNEIKMLHFHKKLIKK